MTTLVGYVRVARSEESYQDQVDALDAAGCERIFVDVAGGPKAPRPGLQDALDYLRENDELLVVSLDRLGPGTADVVRILNGLEARGIAFRAIRDGLEGAPRPAAGSSPSRSRSPPSRRRRSPSGAAAAPARRRLPTPPSRPPRLRRPRCPRASPAGSS
ncbi:recombinase family protein [Clavibacter capsici]|uniref:recombinase family protein n=1 Tax=Clavibacter capsici TaxID=1874630 RepID=UPI00287B979C|nr:recombinase family protein [Clavibacter capsici]